MWSKFNNEVTVNNFKEAQAVGDRPFTCVGVRVLVVDDEEMVEDQLVIEEPHFIGVELFRPEVTGDTKVLRVGQGKAQLELVYDIDPQVPAVLVGDAEKITHVMKALLENAIKFTEEGVSRMISLMPITMLMGVRNSWETLERSTTFSRPAAASCSTRRSFCRCSASRRSTGCVGVWSLHIGRGDQARMYENLCAGLMLLEFLFFGRVSSPKTSASPGRSRCRSSRASRCPAVPDPRSPPVAFAGRRRRESG